jgi:hypothetical protein
VQRRWRERALLGGKKMRGPLSSCLTFWSVSCVGDFIGLRRLADGLGLRRVSLTVSLVKWYGNC